jgi:tetratricopeptide (TPR) repeat protein
MVGREGLEELIEESLRQKPVFESSSTGSAVKKEKKKRNWNITDKLAPLAVALANAGLAAPGNPIYAAPIIGSATYFLADRVFNQASRSKNIVRDYVGHVGEGRSFDVIFEQKLPLSFLFGALNYVNLSSNAAESGELSPFTSTGNTYLDYLKIQQDLTPEIALSVINGFGAYYILSKFQKVLGSEGMSGILNKALAASYRSIRKPHLAIKYLRGTTSLPHSKEKEVLAMLQLGDAHMDLDQIPEAVSVYKKMLVAASRDDDVTGASDWLVRRKSSHDDYASDVYSQLQRAMHYFVDGNLEGAHSVLTDVVREDPENRQLRRMKALFFEATGNNEQANLEMRIYGQLLRRDQGLTYKLLGESRNEVLIPQDETEPMPDVFIKRNTNPSSLEEEVANIQAFSQELPGRLPKVVGQGSEGNYHDIMVESLGTATMTQKAANNMLTLSDIKSVIDLFVDVIAAGERLRARGALNVSEPILADTYSYVMTEAVSRGGDEPVVPNFFETEDGRLSIYFARRLTDLYMAATETFNDVEFSPEYYGTITEGAIALDSILASDQSLNFVYTDFTPRNVLFSDLAGPVSGKIDWESVKIMPAVLELVNIIEFRQLDLQQVPYDQAIEHFIKKFQQEMGVGINRKHFDRLYHAAAVQRHLELIGYRGRDAASNPENLQDQIYHYVSARTHLFDLINQLPKEWKPHYEEPLRNMLGALEKTPILSDAELQRDMEARTRPTNSSERYNFSRMRTKEYWGRVARELSWNYIKKSSTTPTKKPHLPGPNLGMGIFAIGIPTIILSASIYTVLSYEAAKIVMPSLPPLIIP